MKYMPIKKSKWGASPAVDKLVPVSPERLVEIQRDFDSMHDAGEVTSAWENTTYLIFVWGNTKLSLGEYAGEMTHLMIARKDLDTFIPWDHKQAIKNQLCGPETEAVELFPKVSRLTDSANMYHLWVLKNPAYGFSFGFYDDPEAVKRDKELRSVDDIFSAMPA